LRLYLTEAPAGGKRVSYEVDRPTQILPLLDHHWRPGAESPLAATTPAHRQTLLFVKPIELLVVELDARSNQQQAETPIAEPPPLRRQLLQFGSKGAVIRPR
jgi:hypothetical protein